MWCGVGQVCEKGPGIVPLLQETEHPIGKVCRGIKAFGLKFQVRLGFGAVDVQRRQELDSRGIVLQEGLVQICTAAPSAHVYWIAQLVVEAGRRTMVPCARKKGKDLLKPPRVRLSMLG